MNDTLDLILPLKCWRGDRGTYHLVTIGGEHAHAIATQATLHRMEFGKGRGFGSVKVIARIGATTWRTSVFPQSRQSEWILLVSKKVMRAEDLAEGDAVRLELELI